MFNIQGKTINFRLAQPDDAQFIYGLRIDSRYNQHLSPTTGTVEDQRNWLENYKKREFSTIEYYFIIQRNDNKLPIGTVRLYDFKNDLQSFCWGSWILNENKTKSAAIESAMLVYEFAFNQLEFQRCHFDVRKENQKVIDFHSKMGAVIVNENDLDYFFILNPKSYFNFKQQYKKYLGETR